MNHPPHTPQPHDAQPHTQRQTSALRQHLCNIYRLGIKELWSLLRDPAMLLLIVYVFTASVYTGATAMPESLRNAPIAIVFNFFYKFCNLIL